MKANQPSPPEQVSVLFKRKTEVVLSKSQSRVRGEMEMGEGKLSSCGRNCMAYEAKKYLYLALFRECLSTLAYIVGEIDNRQISLNLGPLFSPLDFPNMRDNTINCLPPFLRWFELRAQR